MGKVISQLKGKAASCQSRAPALPVDFSCDLGKVREWLSSLVTAPGLL